MSNIFLRGTEDFANAGKEGESLLEKRKVFANLNKKYKSFLFLKLSGECRKKRSLFLLSDKLRSIG